MACHKAAVKVALGAVFLAGVTSGALASQIGLSVDAVVGANTGGKSNTMQFAESLVPSPIVVPEQDASIAFNNGTLSTSASSVASGTIQFGSILGFVSSTGFESLSSAPPGMNLNNTNASANFVGTWQDTLTVTSSILAPGTPVDLSFTMFVDATLVCSGPDLEASVSSVFSATGSNGILLSTTTCNSIFDQSKSTTLTTAVGNTLQIRGQLVLFTLASGRNEVASSSMVDPPSSSFFIDSLTSGASYTTGSGNTYFSAAEVPEPRTVPIVASAFLLLFSSRFFVKKKA